MNIYVNNICTNVNTCPLLRTASRITIKNIEKNIIYALGESPPCFMS